MYFLRIDYIPSCGGVSRVRGLYESLAECMKVLSSFEQSSVLLVRCELCA